MPSVEYRFEYDASVEDRSGVDAPPAPVEVVRLTVPLTEWSGGARKVERRLVREQSKRAPKGMTLANFVRPCQGCGGSDNGYRRLCDPCKAILYPK